MQDRVVTVVRETEDISIEIDLRPGSSLTTDLFIFLYISTEEIGEAPWTTLFADDLVLCDSNADTMEKILRMWRRCLEGKGLKLSERKI